MNMKKWTGAKNTHIKIKRYTLATKLRSIFYAHSMRVGKELLN